MNGIRTILWACAVSAVMLALGRPTTANTRFVLEPEGYITPNLYFRTLFLNDPTTGIFYLGYIDEWKMSDGKLKAVWWAKANDEGDKWTGPEIWPSWNLTKDLKLEVEARYLIGLEDTNNQVQGDAMLTYNFSKQNAVGLATTYTNTLGDGNGAKVFFGPMVMHSFSNGNSLMVSFIEGVEGTSNERFVLRYVIAK